MINIYRSEVCRARTRKRRMSQRHNVTKRRKITGRVNPNFHADKPTDSRKQSRFRIGRLFIGQENIFIDMAVNDIAFQVNLKKDTNSASRTYGMYFGEAESKKPLSLKGFAKHISEHGKLVDYPMAVLVIQNIVSCLIELVTQGVPVKMDSLGTFYPTIENKKGGVESPLAYDPTVHVEGVHLRFLPEGEKDGKLTSRALKDMCVFQMKDLITVRKLTVNGKVKRYQTRIPISDLALAQTDSGGTQPVEP